MRFRRWMRFALPLGAVAALATLTGVAHVVQQPDPTDSSFLSPTSDAGDGARGLADALSAAGVRIDVQTGSAGALAAARSAGSAVVFVTTPGLVHPDYLEQLAALPPPLRVVLVAPQTTQLEAAGFAVRVRGPRWTATAPQPGCSAGYVTAAGPAAVTRWRYDTGTYPAVRCYDDGLVEITTDSADLTLVGAADPFRNDRAGEHGNRALAQGLLARDRRVIWLDLHEREPAPPPDTDPQIDPRPDPEQTDEGGGDSDSDEPAEPPQAGEPDGDPQGAGRQGEPGAGGVSGVTDSPLARAFPPVVWAVLTVLALAALALAAASARRLGAPVAEPLPVRVRAAETVRGLGGLYQRAGARSTSLATVQAAARDRLAAHYGLGAEAGPDEVAERVAATLGQPFPDVRQVLAGGIEDSDEELARAATAVQNLVRHVTGQQNWQQGPDEGNVT